MNTLSKPAGINSREIIRQTQTEVQVGDPLLEIATHHHREAIRHQQEGDHEKAARDILLALSYYRKAE